MREKELLLYMARALVDAPDQVSVEVVERDEGVSLELRVASGDMGKVIGRQGRIAREIRTLVKASAARAGRRVHVEIVD